MNSKTSKTLRIALLFNANKVYDRDVISGIGDYINTTKIKWDVYIEEDFRCSTDILENWDGDGIIANFDDVSPSDFITKNNIPAVVLGTSFRDESKYPDMPYIVTDNYGVIKNAYEHLRDKGITEFAFYGLPSDEKKLWSVEREMNFKDIMRKTGHKHWVYRGVKTSSLTWGDGMRRLSQWLKSLPIGTGIIAITDSRARHLLQACEHADIIVPDHLSIIGIDNERVARNLMRVPLSSVDLSCQDMGHEAAKMLHKIIEGENDGKKRIVVTSTKVHERESTNYRSAKDPYVIKAMHYIRTNIKNGIKVYHVLDELRVSRSNLEERFKAELGRTVHQEIHETRIKLACSYLENTEIPIGDIFSMCGYPSLQYMYSVFSKSLNMTPKQYRESIKKHEAVQTK